MVIKEKIGSGSFCKVKKVILSVNREGINEETGEKTLTPCKQELACKIFNRKALKGQKTVDENMRMSD